MIEQRSQDWYQVRLGKVTASKVADIMARTKSGYSASPTNYEAFLIAERLTGTREENFINAAMQHGIDTEPQAIAAYEFLKDARVTPAGFVDHPTIAMSGASPDGYVGEHGLIEVKCPNTATHLDMLLKPSIPKKYQLQMQFQMACTGRVWCDFMSFDPRLPARMQMFIQRVKRDDEAIAELEGEVTKFIADMEAKIERLEALAA